MAVTHDDSETSSTSSGSEEFSDEDEEHQNQKDTSELKSKVIKILPGVFCCLCFQIISYIFCSRLTETPLNALSMERTLTRVYWPLYRPTFPVVRSAISTQLTHLQSHSTCAMNMYVLYS